MRDISVLSLACKVVLLEQLYSGMSQQVDLLHNSTTNIILSQDRRLEICHKTLQHTCFI